MQALKGAWRNAAWSPAKMPDLSGRTFVVTGGSSGVGLAVLTRLLEHHAFVVVTARSEERALAAIAEARAETATGVAEFMRLDTSDLDSVKAFADAFAARGLPLHGLVCNAGVMAPEGEGKSKQGLDIHMATKSWGHFYLAHLLLPQLKASAPARLVVMASAQEARGAVPWDDLGGAGAPRGGASFDWYGASNVCNIMWASELDARLKAAHAGALSDLPEAFAVQPGMARTPLFAKMRRDALEARAHDAAQRAAGQSAGAGALSTLYALTEPALAGRGGGYYGPPYVRVLGAPVALNVLNTARCFAWNAAARDPAARARLYDAAADLLERLTRAPLPHRLPPRSRGRAPA